MRSKLIAATAVVVPLLVGLGAEIGDFQNRPLAVVMFVLAGVALIAVVGTWPPLRNRLPAFRHPYSGECAYNEGLWWLTLRGPEAEAQIECTVRHETGTTTRKQFGERGSVFQVRYPEDFESHLMPIRQPWGNYRVTWRIAARRGGKTRTYRVRSKFTWKPFQAAASPATRRP